MSALIDFINNHENWKQELTNAPYNLKINHDGRFTILKYNQIESDFNYLLVNEARGCIVAYNDITERWEYAARPFTRFYNYGEEHAATIDWAHATAREKIDGALIKAFYDHVDGYWRVATNGTIDAYKAAADEVSGTTFGELFECAVINTYGHNFNALCRHLDRSMTHMFELVSPEKRVVLQYDETKMYYLGSRFNTTGEYVTLDQLKYMMPHEYEVSDLEQILATVANMGEGHEGIVVFDGVNRIKCKTEEYVRMPHMINNGMQSWERLVKIVLENEQSEFINYCPQYEKNIQMIQDKMYSYNFDANMLAAMACPLWNENIARKDWAEMVKKFVCPNALKSYLFKLYDNHDLTWQEYTHDWDENKWVRSLNLKEKVN